MNCCNLISLERERDQRLNIGFIFHINEQNFTEVKEKMTDLDTIDMDLLALLGKNGRSTAPEISKELSEIHVSLTDRAVLQRIARLQEKKIIQGYTTILNPAILTEKNTSLILLKFATSAERIEIERLDAYLTGASFCLSAARLGGAAGEFDYICKLVFDSQKQFDLMLSVILRRFGKMISEYMIYQSKITGPL